MISQNENSDSSKNQVELFFHLTQVIKLLKKEFLEEITFSVISAIEKKSKFQIQEESGKLLNTSELVNFLGVSKSTIIKLREEGLPIIKIGDTVRFDKQDVLRYIRKYKQEGGENIH